MIINVSEERAMKERDKFIEQNVRVYLARIRGWFIACMILFSTSFAVSHALAFNLNVIGANPDGTTTTVTNYRWLLEEDATHHVIPGDTSTNWAVDFHKSYMPVVAEGHGTGTEAITVPDTAKHYYVSVLSDRVSPPGTSYSIGGAPVAPGQTSVTVYVNALPFPTAQITIFVFEDNQPINNAPDLPAELGLEGFSIVLEDAGGRYGISAGQQMMDAFGNPLGTEYDAAGNPIAMGTGIILTDADGMAKIKYLAPGKYGIKAVPPVGQDWIQTLTIEGTKTIDAWVKANEPPYFAEFGPPGPHVAIGFVQPTNDTTVLTGGSVLSGQVVNLHLSRPPDFSFHAGAPFAHTTPWVGLNLGAAGAGRGVYAQRCNPDGTFDIPNVPPGDYQLVIWDDNLDLVFAFHTVIVNPDGSCNTPTGSCNFGEVPVFQWFTRQEHWVFNDDNGDGFWDTGAGEMGMPEQNINLRWRDGTIFQAFPTDRDGFVPFDQVFPFFSWLVAEVDFARFKATGVTVVVDGGGAINAADPWTFGGQLNPQDQDGTWGLPIMPYRTEEGPVLTQAFQGFLGQTSVFMWGKKAYGPEENGGISGIVFYSTTRAENRPEYGVAEVWEPGIPGVTVNLYDITSTVLLNTTTTDNWDETLPSGCPGDPADPFYMNGKCYDGMRNWNQVRPGIFDGGYAFMTYFVDGTGTPVPYGTPGASEVPLPQGQYIVEVVPPPGYKVVRSQDKNVDFGDEYVVSPLALPSPCVGATYEVPPELSLFPGISAPLAGETMNLCDRKLINLNYGKNAAADFFLFTEVPIAGHIVGGILDDAANEFDPTSPQFGEKYAPPWIPVSIRDWTGRELSRVYSDQYGRYNALVPSTYTANLPQPSGMSPNMITICLNSPTMPNPASPGMYIPDPQFNPQYSQFCYTFQYMPGTTTYLDTPVIPVAAFAGPDQFPLDCEFTDGTPVINRVTNMASQGPYVSSTGQQITIISEGNATPVPNPAYCPGPPITSTCPVIDMNKTIPRDFSFGSTVGTVTIDSMPLTVNSWTTSPSANGNITTIVATVPAGVTTGQLKVTRGDNSKFTVIGLTVTIGGPPPIQVGPLDSIQAVIDGAASGSLVHVQGLHEELVIMWKPVRLQGWGTGSATINAVKTPAEKLQDWRTDVQALVTSGSVDLLPSQETGPGGLEPALLFDEEGPAIIVLSTNTILERIFGLGGDGRPNARIDGFTITGADHAGGIMVNGYAHYLEIGNNRIINNNGFYGGGIRIGHPALTEETPLGPVYQNSFNDNISIHNNHILQNGGLDGAGGGVSLHTGADSYQVKENYICGNFTPGEGGGIGHLGLSHNGLIADNTIIFNESFNQGMTVSGGGVFIGGGAPLGGTGSLTEGSGSVKILSNLIQGNSASAGDGGGIRISRINGQDAENSMDPNDWYVLDIFNNMIANNVAGLAGAGISLQDAARVNIIHNTIVRNDSTGTAGEAFSPGSPNESNPQPAGIVSRVHSPELGMITGQSFSDPQVTDNIIWQNRSFYFFGNPNAVPPVYQLLPLPNAPLFWDLEVLGTDTPQILDPQYCILTDTIGYGATNIQADPIFVSEYFNGDRGLSIANPEGTTAIQAPPAFDEGGNFIRVRFGPLTLTRMDTGQLYGDYHIQVGSPAVNSGLDLTGTFSDLAKDYDGETRPNGADVDIGADELYYVPPPMTYSISGTVRTPDTNIAGSPIAGVTMTLTGAAGAATTTNALGNYTFTGLVNGSYTVTPSLVGYTFTPTSRAVTVSGANVGGQNFTGTPGATPTYSISGTVSTAGGSLIAGVTMTLTGAAGAVTTTNALGNYTFTGLANGSYTVTPSLVGYTFTPTSRNVTVSGANVGGQNFTGTPTGGATYFISGAVSTAGGSTIAGVTMTLTGAAGAATTTNALGNYTFTGLANGSYTVTPSLVGYTFTPTSRAVTVSGANVGGQNFTGTPTGGATYSISGTVVMLTSTGNVPIAGVTMTLTGATGATTTTNALGQYTFTGLANGNYTVTPSKTGLRFVPIRRNVTISGANITGQNFTGR